MSPEEYVAAQTVISAATVRYASSFGRQFASAELSPAQWVNFLQLIYPEVERRRAESASLARSFYDEQRAIFHPELPRNDRPLEGTQFPEFVRNMQPVRAKVSQADSPQAALNMLALRTVREVENAGRQQLIHAVKHDDLLEAKLSDEDFYTDLGQIPQIDDLPEPTVVYRPEEPVRKTSMVKGWARVATGSETCAWCLMLISRGPVFKRAESAGFTGDFQDAIKAFEDAGQDHQSFFDYIDENEFMEEWHTGCDCKVVPVFSLDSWPGKAAEKRALKLWIDAGIEASERIASGKARTNDMNLETQNALRRRLYRGEIDPSEYAFG